MRGRGEVGSAVIAAALALALTLPAGPATAQEAQEATAGVFGESVDVKVVNVEVVVTGRDGGRVAGLSPDDFRLVVDGQEVPIDYFTEVRDGEAVAASAGGAVVPSAVAAGEPVGTSYLVFIDDRSPITMYRNQTLQALRDDLGRLGPADRMAIVAYDGRDLELMTGWSSSVPELERAVDRAAARWPYDSRWRPAERLDPDAAGIAPASFGSPGSATRIDLDERAYITKGNSIYERPVAAAVLAMRAFAAVPGRKVLLLLAEGLPFWPIRYSGRSIVIRLPNPLERYGERLYGPLADTANRLGYTIYGVDVPGFGGSDLERNGHDTLLYLAEETGGRALLNGQRLEAFEEVRSDTRSYYWLGFSQEGPGDDRRHRIEVEVRRPDLRARARESFFDFSRRAEVTARVESELLFGDTAMAEPAGSGPLAADLAVEVGEPRKSGRRVEVPLALAIPAEAVTVVPIDGRWVAELELRIAVRDDRGDRAEVPVVPLRLSLAEPPAAGSTLAYETTIRLRALTHDLVVSVFDPLSGAMLSSTAEVAPPG